MARRRPASAPGPSPEAAGDLSAAIAPHAQGAVLSLIVTPRSGVTAFASVEGDALRLRVAAPPVDGAANAAVVKHLAEVAGVPKSSVAIVAGQTGRRKRVLLAGMSRDGLAARLRTAVERDSR
jgi:uncharacterized protein